MKDIVLPYQEGSPSSPSVGMMDKIVHAIELMLNHNLRIISVVHNERPVGTVRLTDALRSVGIQVPSEKIDPEAGRGRESQ